jgi:hypothetical protein
MQLALDCRDTIGALTGALEALGLRVYRSFDLRAALVGLPHCSCPHHGTEQCTCQYAVLLVYGAGSSPVQLVAHGRDGHTWLKLLPLQHPSAIQEQVRQALAAFSRWNSGTVRSSAAGPSAPPS